MHDRIVPPLVNRSGVSDANPTFIGRNLSCQSLLSAKSGSAGQFAALRKVRLTRDWPVECSPSLIGPIP